MPPNLVTPPSRLASINLLRGLVIILMALDHARDYFAPFPHQPTDLEHASPALFLTRWITHFCAPVFVFLAGTSIYLRQHRPPPPRAGHVPARLCDADSGGTPSTVPPSQPGSAGLLGADQPDAPVNQTSLPRFLLTRGLFLIALELTVIAASWGFLFAGVITFQVIWALGVSMIVMAALVRFPWHVSLIFGAALVTLHNLLDPIPSADFTSPPLAALWMILHEQNFISLNPAATAPFTPPGIFVVYPLIPWVGVMALGYAFGRLFSPPPSRAGEVPARSCDADGGGSLSASSPRLPTRACILLGSLCILTFLVLRATSLYGDPTPFDSQSPRYPILALLNTTKYPPSLQFLLMTLGPALLLLPVLPRLPRPITTILNTFGRVPLFFYVLHIPLLHLCSAILWYALHAVITGWQLNPAAWPTTYTPQLWIAYAAWLLTLLILWFPCRWFMRLRNRRKDWWLSYL